MSEPEWRKILAESRITIPMLAIAVIVAVLITWLIMR